MVLILIRTMSSFSWMMETVATFIFSKSGIYLNTIIFTVRTYLYTFINNVNFILQIQNKMKENLNANHRKRKILLMKTGPN